MSITGGALTILNEFNAPPEGLVGLTGHECDKVIHTGTNGKMTEICEAMGLVNLDSMGEVVLANKRNYEQHSDELAGLPGLMLMRYNEAEKNNYQYVVVEVGRECPAPRDELVDALHKENVIARKYF